VKKRYLKVLELVGILPNQPAVGSQIDSLRKAGVEIEVLDLSASCGKGWKKYLRGIFVIRKLVRLHRYDLIHAHYGYCGWVARFQRKYPVVVTFMGSDLLGVFDRKGRKTLLGRISQWCSRLLVPCVDQVIVMSQQMLDQLSHKDRVTVLSNGVDFDLFKLLDRKIAREHFGLDALQKIVLFAANPQNAVKNYALAQEAFDRLKSTTDLTCSLWVFTGHPQKELSIAMNAADVLLLTSYSEGSPNVVKEALACNLPIVSVRVGDVPDIIKGICNCHLADYASADIAEKLFQVINTGGRSNGRQHIEDFRMETVAQRLIELYRNVVL
jgi:glycosyltransferase involved in cell wall biosynthesis